MTRNPTRQAAGIALASALILLYELVQVRVFSYSLHPIVAYSAIAIAMLGFGLGATVLSLRSQGASDRDASLAPAACLGLGISIVLVNVWFARTSPHVVPPNPDHMFAGWTSAVLLPCILPYFFAGVLSTLVLRQAVDRIGTIYAWNLAGSALGCVAAGLLLRPIGAERLIAACAVLALVAGLVLSSPGNRLRSALWAGALILLAAVAVAPRLMPFEHDDNDLIYVLAREAGEQIERESGEWDPVGKIEVVRHREPLIHVSDPIAYRTITNDSGAMALLLNAPAGRTDWGKEIFEQSLYSLPYWLEPNPSVLVIGVGGGFDVNTALHWHSPSITAVEISKSTIRALTGPYAQFAGWPLSPQVHLLHGDGRTFARATSERFDIVQLSGVDTFTMHSANAMVTAEDFLYTQEAFQDFLALLTDRGVLSVTRYGDEAMNLAAIAARALRHAGVEHPERQIVSVRQSRGAGVLVRRSPFTPEQIDILHQQEDRQELTGVRIPHYDAAGYRAADPIQILYPPSRNPDPKYVELFQAMPRGREVAVMRKYNNPFLVPVDDRPYYILGVSMPLAEDLHPVVRALRISATIIAFASLLLMLVPVLAVRRSSRAPLPVLASTLAYFFALGAGFMLLEVGLIHRTVVLVGTPGGTVAVIMTSILLSSGIGSWVAERSGAEPLRRIAGAAVGLCLLAALYALLADPVTAWLFTLPAGARIAGVAVCLAPAGFVAGWFFPSGLKAASGHSAALIPWAMAVNGFASVLGSLAALPLGVSFGFKRVFLIAVCIYLAGVIAFIPVCKRLGAAAAKAQ